MTFYDDIWLQGVSLISLQLAYKLKCNTDIDLCQS